MAQLFRDEALQARGDRLLGEVVIAQPLALRMLALFLTGLVVCIGVLVATASYARKETVTGYLSPAAGIVKVHASQAGVISALLVQEGDAVAAGTPLVKIRSARVNGGGIQVNPAMIRSVGKQLRELEHLEELLATRSARRAEQLEARLEGLRVEETALRERVSAQRQLKGLTSANLERLRGLTTQGYVSERDLDAKEEALLAAVQQASALNQELAALRSRIGEVLGSIGQLPLELAEQQSELRARRADLELRRLQLTGQGALTILAPIAGQVSTAAVVVGDSVASQQHLLTLLPMGSALEAHLVVPTRAIGFVNEGQEVRILYDAFDYRRYGVQEGRVREISTAVLPAGEMLQFGQRHEPSFKVKVELADQAFTTKHHSLALQAGMTLRADIVLEQRTLLGWLATPILGLRGRT